MENKPESFHLQWHITDICNLKCKHCYRDELVPDLNFSDLMKILGQYAELRTTWNLDEENSRISLTGGEPLLRKDIFQLVEEINRRGLGPWYLTTNGTTITQDIARQIKQLGVSGVQISLDGMEKNHDFIRGRGSFRKAVYAALVLVENGIWTCFSMTLTKMNVSDVPDVIKLAENIGVNDIMFGRLVPSGRGAHIRNLMLGPEEVRQVYRLVHDYSTRSNAKVNVSMHCSDALQLIDYPGHQMHGCSVGWDSFSISPNGDVMPCRRMPVIVGNVLEKSMLDIWNDSEILRKLRDRSNMDNRCRQCELFERCHGSGRCIAYGYFGDMFKPDPQCWKLFDKLPSEV